MDVRGQLQVLPVRNVARAVATFRDVLGFRVLVDHGWAATIGVHDGAQMLVVDEQALAVRAGSSVPDIVRVA